MDTIKSEKGYTLVLVMIIITVAMIFGMAVTGVAITTNKQVKKTDNLNKATKLAEMGITYYKQVNKNLVIDAKNNAAAKVNGDFCSEFNQLLTNNSSIEKTVENQNIYQITLDSVTPCMSNPSQLDVVFYSSGITDTRETVKLKGRFVISKKSAPFQREGEKQPVNDGKKFTYYDDLSKKEFKDLDTDNDKKVILDTPSWFVKIELNGNRTVIDNAEAVFGDLTQFTNNISQNSHTNITINGDAIFFGTNPIAKQTNKATICITGDAYIVESADSNGNGVLKPFTNFDYLFNLSEGCKKDPPVEDWSFDSENGVFVDYNAH